MIVNRDFIRGSSGCGGRRESTYHETLPDVTHAQSHCTVAHQMENVQNTKIQNVSSHKNTTTKCIGNNEMGCFSELAQISKF